MLDSQIAFIGFTEESAQIAECLGPDGPQVEAIYTEVTEFVPSDWKEHVLPLDSWHELLVQQKPTLIIISLTLTTPQNQDMLRKLVSMFPKQVFQLPGPVPIFLPLASIAGFHTSDTCFHVTGTDFTASETGCPPSETYFPASETCFHATETGSHAS